VSSVVSSVVSDGRCVVGLFWGISCGVFVDDYDVVLFDLDGVVYVGFYVVEGVVVVLGDVWVYGV